MRARNIKPGFFRNEELAEISPGGRLLFIGLWCMADREGLLQDRPKKIKLEIMPYDDINCDKLLQELHDHSLILRYNVNGNRYISVPNFSKHQRPHPNEKPSEIPPPSKPINTKKTLHQGTTLGEPREAPLGADILNPDILNPDKGKGGEPPGVKTPLVCPQKAIIQLYQKIIPEMPEVRVWNDAQAAWLRARWNEDPERQSLEWWEKYFTWIRESDWLMGRTKEEFACDLEWLIRRMNFAKIANGRYHRKKRGQFAGIDEWLKMSQKIAEKEEKIEKDKGPS